MRPPAPILALVLALAVPAAAGEPPRVTSVTVEADATMEAREVSNILGLQVGEPLDRSVLRQGIRALYAGGNIESLSVSAAPDGDGVAVTVRLNLRPRISRLRIEGVGPLWKIRIRRWIRLARGDPFSAAALEAAVHRTERELANRGFAEALVEPEAEYLRTDNTVDVTVRISLGEPARLASLEFEGIEDPEGRLAAASGLAPGKRLSVERLDRARDRIEAALREMGHWEAQVFEISRIPVDGGVRLLVEVDPGPRYQLELLTDPEDEKEVLKALPGPEVTTHIHPAQTEASSEYILDRLQERGYLLAKVEVSLDETVDPRRFTVRVDLGPRCTIGEVTFPGVDEARWRKLRKQVKVHKGRVGGWLRQKVSASTLEQDRQILVQYFRARGLPDATVGSPRIELLDERRVRVAFPVDPGGRWTVESLVLEAFPVECAPGLEGASFPLKEKGPWDPTQLEPMRQRLEIILHDSGYPDAAVEASAEELQEGRMRVRFTADTGPFVTISSVVVTGLRKTRESVVRRTVTRAGFAEGAPYSFAALLSAQRRLYQLGLFRSVEIVPIPGQEGRAERAYVVRCDEGLQRSYSFGVGWDTINKAHISLGWSHLNLFGGAHAFSVDTRLSTREQRYRLSLREMSLPWLHTPGSLTIFKTFERFTSYEQNRWGAIIDVGDRLKRPYRMWWRYSYQVVDPDGPPDVIPEIGRENQRARISALTPTVELDLRDDPFMPRRGIYSSLSVQYAFPLLDADSRFLKGLASFSAATRMANGTGAVGLRLGAMKPIARGGNLPDNLKVPISERFFAGGSASHRAFGLDMLGIPGQTINDKGNPIGGNALVLLNLEYRRTLKGPFSAVLFVDGGNVWASPGQVRWGDMRWGIGAGLRLDTPAGPIRVEYGHKLDRRPGESNGEWWLAFGMPF